MSQSPSVHVHHTTSHARQFVGRKGELDLLRKAWENSADSVIALVGPGGQGKTAIVQQWLEAVAETRPEPAGIFLWSFYRGKDSDLCLRALFAAVAGLSQSPEVSASYCVDHLLPLLRSNRWSWCSALE